MHTGVDPRDVTPIRACGPITYFPSHICGESGTMPMAFVYLFFALLADEGGVRSEKADPVEVVECERAWFSFDEAVRRVRSTCTSRLPILL